MSYVSITPYKTLSAFCRPAYAEMTWCCIKLTDNIHVLVNDLSFTCTWHGLNFCMKAVYIYMVCLQRSLNFHYIAYLCSMKGIL